MKYLLEKIRNASLDLEPFPHIVIRDALGTDDYRGVAGAFPEVEDFHDLEALRRAGQLMTGAGADFDGNGTPLGEYLAFLRSEVLFEAVFDRFAKEIRRRYWVSKREPHKMTSSVRFTLPAVDEESGISRGPHNDHARTLFTLLHYFRPADDVSPGGDLGLFKLKTDKPRTLDGKPRDFLSDDVEIVKTVPYDANVLVAFVNSPTSVHGGTYHRSSVARRYLSATVEFNRSLYWAKPPSMKMRLHRMYLTLRSRLG